MLKMLVAGGCDIHVVVRVFGRQEYAGCERHDEEETKTEYNAGGNYLLRLHGSNAGIAALYCGACGCSP
jgi:hypothetical protein